MTTDAAHALKPWEIYSVYSTALPEMEMDHRFAPIVALPDPYRPTKTPERHLAIALLEQVLFGQLSIFENGNMEDVGEDLWWIFWDEGHERPFSFTWCCTCADLEPEAVRSATRSQLIARARFLPASECERFARWARERRGYYAFRGSGRARLFQRPGKPRGIYRFPEGHSEARDRQRPASHDGGEGVEALRGRG